MSDLSEIQKALEASQKELKVVLDEQAKAVKESGQVSKEAQEAAMKLQEEMKTLGSRLFDLEQQGVKGGPDSVQKSFEETVAEKAIEGWDGKSTKVDVSTFYKALGSGASSAGGLVLPQQNAGILMPGLRRLVIRDLLAQGRISSNSLEYVRENVFTNSAAPVAEGALKPESNLTFTKESMTVKTIAHWVQASRQIMDDAPALQSYLGNRLLYGLALVEEAQLLNGNGTGDNLQGLNTVASAYDTGLNATGDNRADQVAHAVFQVTESEFDASGIILNPRDWHAIAMLKDGEGRYIFGGPQAFASRVMWGLPVVPTKAQAAGTFTVGAFDLASQIWDRMDATIEISREDRDNFVKNMLTVLCEERLGLAHYRPTAIIKGTFTPAA